MLKVLDGVGLGYLLFTNPGARQITAAALRGAADASEGRATEYQVPGEKHH